MSNANSKFEVASPPLSEPSSWHRISATVNGRSVDGQVESRLLLSDFLRHRLGLTGTHVGCEQGSCGACTVVVDDAPVRSCLMFAAQIDGRSVTTVESLAGDELHPLQQAFHDCHGLQCGYCTPGFLMSLISEYDRKTDPDAIDDLVDGNLCRCTGYSNIRVAVRQAFAADNHKQTDEH